MPAKEKTDRPISGGFVQLPLEEYNKLHDQVDQANKRAKAAKDKLKKYEKDLKTKYPVLVMEVTKTMDGSGSHIWYNVEMVAKDLKRMYEMTLKRAMNQLDELIEARKQISELKDEIRQPKADKKPWYKRMFC